MKKLIFVCFCLLVTSSLFAKINEDGEVQKMDECTITTSKEKDFSGTTCDGVQFTGTAKAYCTVTEADCVTALAVAKMCAMLKVDKMVRELLPILGDCPEPSQP